MRKVLILIISIFSLVILGCMPEIERRPQSSPMSEPPPSIGRINSDQPIPIGEIIFLDRFRQLLTPEEKRFLDDPDLLETDNVISYTYLGIDDKNNVRVACYEKSGPPRRPTQNTLPLLLPLNDKKQTILRVKTAYPRPLKRDLLITVVDQFNRITVEEIGKNPDEGW